MERYVTDFTSLVAAAAAASHGDTIVIATPVIYGTASLTFNRAVTIRLAQHIASCLIDMGTYDITLTSDTSGAVKYYWQGNFEIRSAAPGTIWGGGSSDAVLRVLAETGRVDFELRGLTIDAQNAGDRAFQARVSDTGGRIAGTCYSCVFRNSVDDNQNSLDSVNDATERCVVTTYNCVYQTSRIGGGFTAHQYAKSIAHNATFSGHRLNTMTPGLNGRVECYNSTLEWPANVASGGADALDLTSPAAPFGIAAITSSAGGTALFQDCTISSLYDATTSYDRFVVFAAASSEITLRRCIIHQYKDGGIACSQHGTPASSTVGGVLTFDRCQAYHHGDPRVSVQIGYSGTFSTFGASMLHSGQQPSGGATDPPTLNFNASIMDLQGAANHSGTVQTALAEQQFVNAVINLEGSLFIRHNFSTTFCHGLKINATTSALATIKHCTFWGRSTPQDSAINLNAVSPNIIGCIFHSWANGINLTGGATYTVGSGWNVFSDIATNGVATDTTKATDLPAGDSGSADANPTFRNATYGTIDARLVAGGPGEGLDDTNDSILIDHWMLNLLAFGPGTIARSPTEGGTWTAPIDAGCYAADSAVVAVTATPTGTARLARFERAITGTQNPQNVAMSAAKGVSAFFDFPLAL